MKGDLELVPIANSLLTADFHGQPATLLSPLHFLRLAFEEL